MNFLIKNKKIILIVFFVIIIILIYFIVSGIINNLEHWKKGKVLKTNFVEFMTDLKNGDSFKASMMFIDNYNNSELAQLSKAPEKSERIDRGYLEYISDTDYMIEYYKNFDVKILKVKNIEYNKAVLTIKATRPNYLKVLNECIIEQENTQDYKFNSEFISKINSKKMEKIVGTYDINFERVSENIWKLVYNEQMKEMLYGETEKTAVNAKDEEE